MEPNTSNQEVETRANTFVHGVVRRRPTTSARRSRGHHVTREASALPDPPVVEQHEDVTQQHEDVIDHQQENEEVGFPGGPSDTSLLTSYDNHVARAVWEGQVSIYIYFCLWFMTWVIYTCNCSV